MANGKHKKRITSIRQDEGEREDLKRLAKAWGVPKNKAVAKAVAMALKLAC